MATQYQPGRPNAGAPARNPEARVQRPAAQSYRSQASRFGDVQPSAQRPRPQRPANANPAARPQRPANGQASRSGQPQRAANGQVRRPANGQQPRRQPPRKRKPNGRFYALLAILAVVIVAVIVLVCVLRKPAADPSNANVTPSQIAETTFAPDMTEDPNAEVATAANMTADPASHADSLAAMLGDSDATVEGLSADQMTKVEDLSINESLPSQWTNVLFLGSDERSLEESARTDSMIICSINTETGEVKLTSVMRDLAVYLDEIGKFAGTYRINAANFFGGEELAMRVVNECFGMNIQYYVHVNFYGFQQIAQQLGGIEMDITESEMNEINYRIYEQYKMARYYGIDESELPNQFLETYGANTHLDGRQTLAYARIRKLDSDYARSERQRKVLVALMNKLKGSDAATLLNVVSAGLPHVKTNLTPDTILSIGLKVLQSGLSDVESFRLPINNSYVQDTREGQDMLYDCDWQKNASELYYFIYE